MYTNCTDKRRNENRPIQERHLCTWGNMKRMSENVPVTKCGKPECGIGVTKVGHERTDNKINKGKTENGGMVNSRPLLKRIVCPDNNHA